MGNNEDYLDSLLNNVTKKLSEFDEDFEQKKQTSDAYMTKKNLPPKTMKALEAVKENQFLREFEDELQQEDADQFLAQFEAELEDEALEFERTREAQRADDDDAYMDQIEQLVGESQSEPVAEDMDLNLDAFSDLGLPEDEPFLDIPGKEADQQPQEDSHDLDAFADLTMDPIGNMENYDIGNSLENGDMTSQMAGLDAPPQGMEALGSLFDDMDSGLSGDLSFMDEVQPEKTGGEAPLSDGEEPLLSEDEETILPEDEPLDDESIMKLLNGMSEDEALSDIGKMLEADEQSISLEDLSADPENLMHAADLAEDRQAEKNVKKEKKKGFFAKLLDLMFGEDEEDEAFAPTVAEADDLDNISDENMEILRAMNGDSMDLSKDEPSKSGKKEKKKKAKKEKKKKEPKEKKEKKKKEPKPKKPKKEKAPREKGPREKPLPKGPVIMIWLLALSVFAFVFISNNLLSKGNALLAAERSFDKGDYVSSYGELTGVKLGESDQEMYERAKVLAGVQTELNAYYSMMDVRKFDLALDCLVRALGRSDLHMAEAEEWGVTTQMNALVSEITMQLEDQFNVSKEQARELYAIEDRDEYSLELDEILKGLGLK